MSVGVAELMKIGFSQKEAKLYLTLLGKGGATAAELTAASALKRPTVYKLLEALEERGLVAQSFRGTRRYFTPEPPDRLMKMVELQKRSVESLLPGLSELFIAHSHRPRVQYYEGVAGIHRIHDFFLDQPAGANYWYFGSMRGCADVAGEDFVADYTRRRVAKGIWSNGIYPHEEQLERAALQGGEKNMRRIRYIDMDWVPNLGTLTLFDHKIAIYSGCGEIFGMIIESAETYTMMKMVWEAMWKLAKPAP